MELTGRTYGELLGPAMKVQSEEEAREYFNALVDRCMVINEEAGKPLPREEVARIQKNNIGYFTGYCDSETMIRVQRLFDCAHPIFGRIEQASDLPAPEEAFQAGVEAATTARVE